MNLSDILIQDHIDVKKLLQAYRNADSLSKCRAVFSKLATKLTQHFYQEEKALIVYLNAGGRINENFSNALFTQHDAIMASLDRWEHELGAGKETSPEALDQIELKLEQHIAFEMESLYEGFDALLDERQKELVAEAIAQTQNMQTFPLKADRKSLKS